MPKQSRRVTNKRKSRNRKGKKVLSRIRKGGNHNTNTRKRNAMSQMTPTKRNILPSNPVVHPSPANTEPYSPGFSPEKQHINLSEFGLSPQKHKRTRLSSPTTFSRERTSSPSAFSRGNTIPYNTNIPEHESSSPYPLRIMIPSKEATPQTLNGQPLSTLPPLELDTQEILNGLYHHGYKINGKQIRKTLTFDDIAHLQKSIPIAIKKYESVVTGNTNNEKILIKVIGDIVQKQNQKRLNHDLGIMRNSAEETSSNETSTVSENNFIYRRSPQSSLDILHASRKLGFS